jgi:hypothetical protein
VASKVTTYTKTITTTTTSNGYSCYYYNDDFFDYSGVNYNDDDEYNYDGE